ncbi:TonB C-terminal domain-containing protein [Aurantiacibacter poecillastricola]|uniref:TonB C-terminal domain-containing protein n=1 Tax=Aurantiacibacter poecillastricola TaxID=3064385 RepID=UPI00273D84AF|nr:TonB C-terminal domain-containing protein [Aurantiacibacter sp. 219JJ12-13]MDP5263466.1 energy transducer TonB [Aurantiacibacter sp. 219JJ12-13]
MFANLSSEERIGLGAALVAHAALAAALAYHATREPPEFTVPERIDVNLATDVSLTSTAPDPSTEPAAATAPELADTPEAPAELVEAPVSEPVERPVTTPPPRASEPRRPAPTPTPQPSRRAETRPAPTPTAAASQRAQGSRLSDDFLEGTSDASGDRGSPAQTVGPAQQASIAQAIIRQLRPHWQPPSGVDVESLVTVVRFRLNRDGSLAGTPEVLRTTGQNDANRAQVRRHQEQAIRAVRLAAPFNLPEQYYSGWRTITSNFDNRLAQ